MPSGYSVSTKLYLTEPVFLYGSAQQPTFTDVSATTAGHVGNGCARIIGTCAGSPSTLSEKTVTLIGIDNEDVQHELYTTAICHNLYKRDLPSNLIGCVITSEYYLDETLTTLLTLPHEVEFDDAILYIYCTVEMNSI